MSQLFTFDSMRDFGQESKRLVSEKAWWSAGWGKPTRELLKKCTVGETEHVPLAEQILAQIVSEVDLNMLRPKWEASVCGAYPVVPDVLAGYPESMRRLRPSPNESVPVRIFYCSSLSSGTSDAAQIKRGCAVLALALILSDSRPVELFTFDVNDSANVMVRLQTNPISLSEVCFALTNSEFTRAMLYGYIATRGHRVMWPSGMRCERNSYAQNARVCGKLVGARPEDIVIPPQLNLDDADVTSNPRDWLLARISEWRAGMEARAEEESLSV